jgi:hypothetical protein
MCGLHQTAVWRLNPRSATYVLTSRFDRFAIRADAIL